MNKITQQHIKEHFDLLEPIKTLDEKIINASLLMIDALKNGKSIFWCGNGGSASDSEHLAGELIGRFVGNRKALKSLSLSADSAVITCIANDFGYDEIFSRQIEGLGQQGDVLVAISTSGKSKNVLNACFRAKSLKLKTIGFLGKGGGEVGDIVDNPIIIPSYSTARIQEMHILIGHILCDLIEEGLSLK